MIGIRSLTAPVLLIAAALVMTGCYTLLKHPRVNTAVYEEVQAADCTSCHNEDELWYYHHAPEHRLYPISTDDAWQYYYAVPWWYDSYWHYSPPPGPTTVPLRSRQVRDGADKDQSAGSIGGPVGPPSDPKSTGAPVRYRHTDDDSTTDSKDAGGKKADDEPKKRDVRPKNTKEKTKAKDKGKPAD